MIMGMLEPLKVGTDIAITVRLDWSEAVNPGKYFHYFEKDDTATSRTYGVKLVSFGEGEGLWVESASDEERARLIKMLIPWHYIFCVRSWPADRNENRVGF
jgi:hypothetical protein